MHPSSTSGPGSVHRRDSSPTALETRAKLPNCVCVPSMHFSASLLDTKGLSNTDSPASPASTESRMPFAEPLIPLMPRVLASSSMTGVMVPDSLTLSSNPLDASGKRSILQSRSTTSDTNGNILRDPFMSARASFTTDTLSTWPDVTTRTLVHKRDTRRRAQKIPCRMRVLLAVLCVLGLTFGASTLAEACLALHSRTFIPASADHFNFKDTHAHLLVSFFVPIIVLTALSLVSLLVFVALDIFAPTRIIISESDGRWLSVLLCVVMLLFAMFGVYTCLIFSYDIVLYRRPPLLALAIVYDVDLFAIFFFFFFAPCSF